MVEKFIEHFLYIAAAMNGSGSDGMWDEEDGFYYDLLRLPDGTSHRLKVRSIVGLLPLCATNVIEKEERELVPGVAEKIFDRIARKPELFKCIHFTGPNHLGQHDRGIGALVNQEKLQKIL